MKICKWKYNSISPVLFMIDDLCNSWVDLNGNKKLELGEDYGAGMYNENSSMKYLEEEILKFYPEVKVNFYVPVGERIGMKLNSNIKMYSKQIDENKEIELFFQKINDNKKYELSYHGVTHGKVFENSKDQLQEWETFDSLDEALAIINQGKEIYKKVLYKYPVGGKYCGYIGGKYGDESIDKSNFFWWHRFWNKGIEENGDKLICGEEINLLKAYDITEFGENGVIDIPSTLLGSLYNLDSNDIIKRNLKKIFKIFFINRYKKQIDFLLENQLVISIQEHISPARDDGKIQTPNIFSDKKSLLRIFEYLKNKNVWYCTGTELAEYYYLRKNIDLKIWGNKFSFDTIKIIKQVEKKELTLRCNKKFSRVITPSNKEIEIKNNIVTLEIEAGIYKLI